MAADSYEGLTHERLHALVASGKPDAIRTRSTALEQAGEKIGEIADELYRMIERTDWKGRGGEAMRDWARSFCEEGIRLSAYAQEVGRSLALASSGLSDAKAAMPKPPPAPVVPQAPIMDVPVKQGEREEALYVISRLSSYYATASDEIASADKPNFKPLGPKVPESPGSPGASGGSVVTPGQVSGGFTEARTVG
ncbi:hypothetical protein H3146_25910, partial [Streptomyces sp. OF3]|nr:hypothetical protein [Streptomyces alkaliterrae]